MKYLLLIACIAFLPIILSAQMLSETASDSLEKVMSQKSEAMELGDKKALSYFADFLDDTTKMELWELRGRHLLGQYYKYYVNERALEYLDSKTDFKYIQFDSKPSKAQFLTYLNNYASSIYYSPFIEKLTDRPLEDFEIDYRLKEIPEESIERFEFEKFDSLFTKRKKNHDLSHDWIADNIKKASALKTPVARQFLYKWITGKYYVTEKYSHPEIIFGGMLEGLLHFEDRETLDTLLSDLNRSTGKIYEQNLFAIQVLTNFDARTRSSDSTGFSAIYNHLIDSLGSIEAMQAYGYEQFEAVRREGFDEKIDYLGFVFFNEKAPNFMRFRARQDMLRLKSPKVLAYLAGLFNYAIYKKGFYFGDLLDMERFSSLYKIEALTNLRLELPEWDYSSDKLLPNSWVVTTNEVSNGDYRRLWYKLYWHNHYQDYVWSEATQSFENIKEEPFNNNQLEEWFDQLRSSRPDVVFGAFEAILESKEDIKKVEQQIKTAQNSYGDSDWVNQKVLFFATDKTLIKLLKHTQYCQEKGINYQLSSALQPLVDTLMMNNLAYSERYFYENKIAYQLSYNDINALERLAIIYRTTNRHFTASMERVLDIWYHENWQSVTQDEAQMILYLRKAALLSDLEYDYSIQWKKASKEQLSQLEKIYQTTTNEIIIWEISQIIPNLKPRKLGKTIDFKYVFTHLDKINFDSLSYSDVQLDSNATDYDFIFQQLDKYDGLDTLSLILGVIERYFNKKMIPYVIKRVDDYRIYLNSYVSHPLGTTNVSYLVADEMIGHLEEFYHIKMPSDDKKLKALKKNIGYFDGNFFEPSYPANKYLSGYHWKKIWKSDSKNYQNWGEKLYKKRLLSFQKREELTSLDFKWLFESPFYKDEYYELIVPLFSKIESCREMERVNFPDIFINEALFNAFQNCNGSLSYKFRKQFKNYSWETIFPVIFKSIQKEKRRYQSSSYKDLLRYDNTWWHDDYLMQNFKDTIANAFEYRMNNSTKEQCYDNCQRILFYIKNYGQPISQYLEGVLKIKKERLRDDILNQLLAHWTYEDLEEILPFFSKFPYWGGSYLHEHFDLLIPDFRPDSIATLQKNVASMSEAEVYLYYLNAAGLDLDFKDTTATYQKIYRALKFDNYFTRWDLPHRSHFKTLLHFLDVHFKGEFSYQTDLKLYERLPSNVLIIRQKEWLNFFEANGWGDDNLMKQKSNSELHYEEIEVD